MKAPIRTPIRTLTEAGSRSVATPTPVSHSVPRNRSTYVASVLGGNGSAG